MLLNHQIETEIGIQELKKSTNRNLRQLETARQTPLNPSQIPSTTPIHKIIFAPELLPKGVRTLMLDQAVVVCINFHRSMCLLLRPIAIMISDILLWYLPG
jgi:hypothetical protein